jgi:isoleucyl-tRNA synthetase
MPKSFSIQTPVPESEENILSLWETQRTFAKSIEQRQGKEPFVFYEGPPTANGKPGIHHVLARSFKDVICRYQTMKGRYVERKAGWDTHGLPVELQVEKALGLKNKKDIEEYGIAEFNKQCQESVWQYRSNWEKLTKRIGYWLDMDHAYVTYDTNYIQSVWWAFKQIWEKGLIYQDHKVVPYCPRCGTGLSAAEVAQGYKEVTEASVYVKFKLKQTENEYILAWTTTPWTLPGNVALAVGKNIPYLKLKQGNDIYYIAKDRVSVLDGDYETLEELTGDALNGKEYESLFDFVDLSKESGKKAYYVTDADFVTTEDGTGVVHTAVMYGEDDFALGKAKDLPAVHTVDEKGQFNELVKPWVGEKVKESDAKIIEYLKEHNLLYKTEQTTHSYPFCWRCDTALLYYARTSWFIKIDEPTRSRLVELNKDIKWVPEHIRDGRFGNWLEGLRDWAISRERYWGTPLPFWICTSDPTHKLVCASLDELREKATAESKVLLTPDFDPHKPYIDAIELTCPDCGQTMKRVPEVADVWFDSGAMPFAQWGLTEKPDRTKFPAQYISEAIDQTRGWFNTLHIISTILFNEAAYESVICLSHILDENGKKMSKSKGNVVDPWDVIGQTGIDALRMYFFSVNQPGDTKNFSIKAVQDVSRKTVAIWRNVVSFFSTYSEVDNWQPGLSTNRAEDEPTLLDQWILALTNQTARKMDAALRQLDTFTAARAFTDYLDQLSTWYLRRSRKRRDTAFYNTLHHVLVQTSLLGAPLMPFIAEETYQALRTPDMAESVHLADYPTPDQLSPDQEKLLSDMAIVRQLVTSAHAIRATGGIKVRQPLAELHITSDSLHLSTELKSTLAEELNVKQVTIGPDPTSPDWLTAKAEEGDYSIALDPNLTEELKREGLIRDLIREFQELRKKSGCQPGEMVEFVYRTDDALLKDILLAHQADFLEEISGRSLIEESAIDGLEIKINGATLMVAIVGRPVDG